VLHSIRSGKTNQKLTRGSWGVEFSDGNRQQQQQQHARPSQHISVAGVQLDVESLGGRYSVLVTAVTAATQLLLQGVLCLLCTLRTCAFQVACHNGVGRVVLLDEGKHVTKGSTARGPAAAATQATVV
jgi:hypothetical protein